jgi:hypothetical protein
MLVTGDIAGLGNIAAWALEPLADTTDPKNFDPPRLQVLTGLAGGVFEPTRMSVVIPCREMYSPVDFGLTANYFFFALGGADFA